MTGVAHAELICKAQTKEVQTGIDGYVETYLGICDANTQVDLYYNEWGELDFKTPEGWHVRPRGHNTNDTVVRCPYHCTAIEIEESNYFRFGPQFRWEDAP